jgi:hypothetical protein
VLENLIQKNTKFDHIFWILIFLYTDPGGILLLNLNVQGGIKFEDIIILLIWTVFFFSPSKKRIKSTSAEFKISIAVVLWFVYFIFIYGILNNETSDLLFFLKKMRRAFYAGSIFFIASYFTSRNTKLFFIYSIIFSAFVLLSLFVSIITGVEIITIRVAERGFSDVERLYSYSYGLAPWLIPISLVILVFKIRTPLRNKIITLGILMVIAWILSITRRHLFSTFFYIIIVYIMAYYSRYMRKLISLRFIPIVLIPIVVIAITSPKYLGAIKDSFSITYDAIINPESASEADYQRLSLVGQKDIMKNIHDEPFLGTGYNHLWFTAEGDKIGMEGADYPFLSAIAMHGIVGLLFFFPIYWFVYRYLFKSMQVIKKNRISIFLTNYDSLMFLSVACILFFNLFYYQNYFGPASISIKSGTFYLSIGMLMGLFRRNPRLIF